MPYEWLFSNPFSCIVVKRSIFLFAKAMIELVASERERIIAQNDTIGLMWKRPLKNKDYSQQYKNNSSFALLWHSGVRDLNLHCWVVDNILCYSANWAIKSTSTFIGLDFQVSKDGYETLCVFGRRKDILCIKFDIRRLAMHKFCVDSINPWASCDLEIW